jgi:hypothetical protein
LLVQGTGPPSRRVDPVDTWPLDQPNDLITTCGPYSPIGDLTKARSLVAAIAVCAVTLPAVAKDVKPRLLETVEGQSITIKAECGKVMADSAVVAMTDVNADNGVIHEIDTVIMPKS